MIAVVRAIGPRDPAESLLACQMAAVHNATIMAARRLNQAEMLNQQDSASNMFNKLTRSYVAQLDALKRYRSTGEQSIRVQHVTVNEGGQAIVGNVSRGAGPPTKRTINLMNLVELMNQAPRCSATSKRSGKPCQAPALKGWSVCRCHGARGGAPTGKRNGRYRHGERTKATQALRGEIAALCRMARQTAVSRD